MLKSDSFINVQPDFLDDEEVRDYTGSTRCLTHGRDCPADLERRVYFLREMWDRKAIDAVAG